MNILKRTKNRISGNSVKQILLVLVFCLVVFAQPVSAAEGTCLVRHKVEAGDTLSYIAELYGVSFFDIAEANNLTEPYVLQVGQILCIPGGKKPVEEDAVEETDQKGLNVFVGYGYIFVDINKQEPRTVYNIRVSKALNRSQYYVVGRLRTNSSGNADGYFGIPACSVQQRRVAVCIKNVWTDETLCETFQNPYYYYQSIWNCNDRYSDGFND